MIILQVQQTTMLEETHFLFTTTNIPKLTLFFQERPDLDISKIRDQKRNTLIHQAAFQNNLTIVKFFIDQIRRVLEKQYYDTNQSNKKPVKHLLQALLNEGNSQGYTCVHYASYKGNVEMIKYLESLGANVMLLTNLGLNCMHLTAQGDQLASALYFYDRFDINSIDNKKGTALHWAAYVGSEDITTFLLAQQQIQIDNFDAEDQTPLHIAVLYGNTSIVKKLLIRGADRSLPNGKGERPIDIARDSQFQRIAAILNNQYTIFDRLKFYFNVRIKYQPQQRSYQRSFWFLFALIVASLSNHLMIVPNFSYIYMYLGIGLNALLIAVYLSLLVQPSVEEPLSYKQLIPHIPICPQCKIPKLPRTHHCNICKKCIRQYDHHCPWINGCVGKHNIKMFPVFLFLLILTFLEIGFLCIVGLFQIQRFMIHFRYTEDVQENNKTLIEVLMKILLGGIVLTIGLFICPIAYLFYVQVMNLFYGKTTFQRFGGKTVKPKAEDSGDSGFPSTQNSLQNKLLSKNTEQGDSCSLGNCVVMCCDDGTEPSHIQI